MCIAWFAVFGRLYLLLYHVFHSLLCTIDVSMYTAVESSSIGDLMALLFQPLCWVPDEDLRTAMACRFEAVAT